MRVEIEYRSNEIIAKFICSQCNTAYMNSQQIPAPFRETYSPSSPCYVVSFEINDIIVCRNCMGHLAKYLVITEVTQPRVVYPEVERDEDIPDDGR